MKAFLNSKVFSLLILIVTLVMIIIMFTSCSTTKEVIVYKTVIKDSMSITVDTNWVTYTNPADSLALANRLYTVTDSLGKCKIQNTQGTVESNKIKIKYIIRNDSIFIDVNTKPYEIKIAQLNTTIEKFKSIYESYTKTSTVATKRPRTWWNWLGYWQSWVCMGFITIVITRFILKKLNLKVGLSTIFPYINISTR